mgnify:CR=1 FL=1
MDRQDFIALMTPQGQQLLNELAADKTIDTKTDLVRLVSRLRQAGHDAGLVAAVLTQLKLRRRAQAKFGEFAERMLFTEAGLEQASRFVVAVRHAGRFRDSGVRSVADLGCGLGAESLALAGIGLEVTAFELDEVTAACATYNLLPFENARVEQADVTTLNLDGYDALFFDPARRELTGPARAQAQRKFDPASFSPNYDWVVEQCLGRTAGVKLGPGHPHQAIAAINAKPDQLEAQWVSVGGDLVELGLWFGAAARPGVARSALLLGAAGLVELNSDSLVERVAPVADLERFLYEPDNSIVRSHLIAELADATGTHAFAPQIAYLTSATQVDSPWLRGFEVLDSMPFDRKKLRAYLQERQIGVLEIKKRGADIVPEQLRKELALKGKNSATLIVTRIGDAHRAIIARAL